MRSRSSCARCRYSTLSTIAGRKGARSCRARHRTNSLRPPAAAGMPSGCGQAPMRQMRKAATAALMLTGTRGTPAASTARGVIGATSKTSSKDATSRMNGSRGFNMLKATGGATMNRRKQGSTRMPMARETRRRRCAACGLSRVDGSSSLLLLGGDDIRLPHGKCCASSQRSAAGCRTIPALHTERV